MESIDDASVPTPILFTHYGDRWIRGSEQLLLDLLRHLDPGAGAADRVVQSGRDGRCGEERSGSPPIAAISRSISTINHRGFGSAVIGALMREARDLVREHEVRVLHSNSAGPCQWLAPVARRARVPLLAHLHIGYLRRSRYAFLLHQAALVVGVSRQVIEPFLDDGMEADRTQVIYNGIDFSRLRPKTSADPRRQLGIADDATVVSAIGSLIRRKGQDVLLRAFALLGPARNVHLLIVSDGPERANLERLTAELGLQARVQFLGYYNDLAGSTRRATSWRLPLGGMRSGWSLPKPAIMGCRWWPRWSAAFPKWSRMG